MKAVTIVSVITAHDSRWHLSRLLIAQDAPQQPAATIRLAVDRVPVDVSIVGDDGRPVTGLTADDFTLDVDGRSRRIVSAQYVSAVRDASAASGAPGHLQLESDQRRRRLIMLVVDRGNIAPGRGRQAMEAAGRFLSRLSSSRPRRSHRLPRRRSVDRFHVQSLSRAERR